MTKERKKANKLKRQQRREREEREAAFWRSVREEDELSAIQLLIDFPYQEKEININKTILQST